MTQRRFRLQRITKLGWSLYLGAAVEMLVTAAVVCGQGVSSDSRFLAGLRQRRLFELAERYCVGRLNEEPLADARRAELVIERSLTLADWAVNSPPDRREPLWRRAVEVTDDFARQWPRSPQLPLVRFQGGLALLARGELTRQEAQLVGTGGSRVFDEGERSPAKLGQPGPLRDIHSVEGHQSESERSPAKPGQPGPLRDIRSAGGYQEARRWLKSAIRLLEALDEEIAEDLRRRRLPGRAAKEAGGGGSGLGAGGYERRAPSLRSPAPSSGAPRAAPDQLPVHQLAELQKNVQYQLARAHRNLAQCYEARSPDWANSLTLAIGRLDPLTSLDPAHPLAWKSRLDEIVCYRLLSNWGAAGQMLNSLLAENPPPAIALRAEAERLRLLLASGRVPDALSTLEALETQLRSAGMPSAGRDLGGAVPPELDYAFLETYLAGWRAATESGQEEGRVGRGTRPTREQAASWQAKATETVRRIQRLHGPYWTRRAQMLLASYVRRVPGGDLAAWTQAADNSYYSGQYDDALVAYDRARSLAQDENNDAEAFRLGYTAATIEHQRGRHAEAMRRYRELAMAMPTHRQAPEAHLLAIYHAAELARHGPSTLLDQYIDLAEEHLATWPDAPTADEVRLRLGQLREYQRRWEQAVGRYQAISPAFAKLSQVVEALDRCYRAWLDDRAHDGQPTAEISARAAAWFEKLILGPQNRFPERWSPVERQAALSAARFRLDGTRDDFARAQWILSAALGDLSNAPPDWQSTARALLVCALAGQGRYGDAAAMLQQVSGGPTEELLDLLRGLAGMAASTGPVPRAAQSARADLAGLELRTVELLRARRESLSPADRKTVDCIRARALADAGRMEQAVEAYQRLSEAYPSDGEIQEGLAQLLLERQDRASLEAALAQWRRVAQKSRPGTDRWFRAKLAVACLHGQLGNEQEAEEMIRLVEILHPEPRLRDRPVTARFLESLTPEMRASLLRVLDRSD